MDKQLKRVQYFMGIITNIRCAALCRPAERMSGAHSTGLGGSLVSELGLTEGSLGSLQSLLDAGAPPASLCCTVLHCIVLYCTSFHFQTSKCAQRE